MKYTIDTEKSEADFTAFAPMHKFKGTVSGCITGGVEFDSEECKLSSFTAEADTTAFTTGDAERNKAMQDFFDFPAHPKAGFTLKNPAILTKKDEDEYSGTLQGELEFAGITRDVPLSCFLRRNKSGKLVLGLSLKWSFKTFGIKAPRLLFLTVKDEVEINASLLCVEEK